MTLFSAILTRLGLSQSRASEILCVPFNTINSWSSGRRTAPEWAFDKLWKIAKSQQDGGLDAYTAAQNAAASGEWPDDPELMASAVRGWEECMAAMDSMASG